jgi:transcriptional regulator with XRE-family HTH domain
MKLGRREGIKRALKAFRATAGLSQMAVAERVGMTERHYWRIENGYDEPTASERTKLAKLLKVTINELPWPVAAVPVERAS